MVGFVLIVCFSMVACLLFISDCVYMLAVALLVCLFDDFGCFVRWVWFGCWFMVSVPSIVVLSVSAVLLFALVFNSVVIISILFCCLLIYIVMLVCYLLEFGSAVLMFVAVFGCIVWVCCLVGVSLWLFGCLVCGVTCWVCNVCLFIVCGFAVSLYLGLLLITFVFSCLVWF